MTLSVRLILSAVSVAPTLAWASWSWWPFGRPKNTQTLPTPPAPPPLPFRVSVVVPKGHVEVVEWEGTPEQDVILEVKDLGPVPTRLQVQTTTPQEVVVGAWPQEPTQENGAPQDPNGYALGQMKPFYTLLVAPYSFQLVSQKWLYPRFGSQEMLHVKVWIPSQKASQVMVLVEDEGNISFTGSSTPHPQATERDITLETRKGKISVAQTVAHNITLHSNRGDVVVEGADARGYLSLEGHHGQVVARTSTAPSIHLKAAATSGTVEARALTANTIDIKSNISPITVSHSIANSTTVRVANGTIRATNNSGPLLICNTHGDTFLQKHTGPVRVSSTSGNIIVENKWQEGQEAETTHGVIFEVGAQGF